ncbi:NADH:ubiquinone oxidoreductase subunit NDUFA12 [Palleronia abyssalis]|uniref:NADH dehydrogenase n=1 Tax=Palleronia abyssalis TaxID=1501240 RepID=A0A2R8BVB6_9RHOB|nr:NADH:ubiquinone oxidoreductase subunit NDUFA12 [Palleronia abyssalis]SPJ24063.1 hypothetical protein PAA8504_01888 [Palleronia abyssalis]
MGLLNRVLQAVTWWNGATLNTLLWSWRNGQKVGEDEAGNTFWQTKDGKRRWVLFNGEAEASRVGPEWHGWLHHTWDEPPTERPIKKQAWEKPHLPNLTGTPAAYAPAGSIRRENTADRSDYEAWTPE